VQETIQNNDTRLIDEVVSYEPVKNTFLMAWEFIVLNKNFTLVVIGILIALGLLQNIELMALFFSIFAGMLSLSVQIYAGRAIYLSKNIDDYISEVKKSDINKIFSQHGFTASGAYLGILALTLSFIFAFALLLGISGDIGVVQAGIQQEEMLAALAVFALPMLLIIFALSYVQPLVQANIILASSFKEGFKAVFTVFSADVWREAFQKSYFIYIAKLGTILMIALILLVSIIAGIEMLIPNIISSIFMSIVMYIFSIITAFGSMVLRRIVEN